MTYSDGGFSDGTRVVHAGLPEPVVGEPFLPGPVFAAPYHLDPVTGPGENDYGRTAHPTRRALEAAIGQLEGAPTLVFASGQAAITALLLSVLRAGDTVALPSDGYFTVRAFAEGTLRDLGVASLQVPTAGPYPDFAGVRLDEPASEGARGNCADIVSFDCCKDARLHAGGVRDRINGEASRLP